MVRDLFSAFEKDAADPSHPAHPDHPDHQVGEARYVQAHPSLPSPIQNTNPSAKITVGVTAWCQ